MLEFEFDRLVSGWRIGNHFWRAMGTALGLLTSLLAGMLLGAWVYASYSGEAFSQFLKDYWSGPWIWIPILSAVAGGIWSLLTYWLKPVLGHWLRERERSLNIQGHIQLPPLFCPDVLIVDNLDRANIKQQRAVLRGIHKHSEQLPMAVVVGMDETALLRDPPDPETPGELLRKVIQVECRIPVRVREDTAVLVQAIANDGIPDNPHLDYLLRSPLFLGDLTRIFALLPDFGPRRVKRFLNDLLWHRHQLGVDHVEDASALARLHGMFDLAPRLRNAGEQLIGALERNDRQHLKELATCYTDHSDQVGQERFIGFVLLTRHLRPRDGVWRTLVARGESRREMVSVRQPFGDGVAFDMDPPEIFAQAANGYSWRLPELWASGRPHGIPSDHWVAVPGERPPATTEERGTSVRKDAESSQAAEPGASDRAEITDDPPARHWPAFESALAHCGSAVERFRLLGFWEHAVLLERDRPDAAVAGAADLEEALFRLYRVWLADEVVLEIMGPERVQELVGRVWECSPRHGALLAHCPATQLPFSERLAVVTNPEILKWRDLSLVQYWLAGGKWEVGEPLSTRISPRAEASMLSEAWPPISEAGRDLSTDRGKSELAWHCDLLRGLRARRVPVYPAALWIAVWRRGWLLDQCRCGNSAAVLEALEMLFHGQSPRERWERLAWDAFRDGISDKDVRGLISEIAQNLNSPGTVTPEQWVTGLVLACVSDAGDECRAWLEKGRAPLASNVLRFLLGVENNPLWREDVADAEKLIELLGGVRRRDHAQDPDWESLSEEMKTRLPELLAKRSDGPTILEQFDIVPLVPDERGT